MDLITDRTQADVSALLGLGRKGWDKMTQAERDEWMQSARGAYNYNDWNRVGVAMAYMQGFLIASGYDPAVLPKINWTMQDIPTPEECETYISSIKAIRDVIALPPDIPTVPNNMNNIDWKGANAIEKILEIVEDFILRGRRSVDLGWALGLDHNGLYGGV